MIKSLTWISVVDIYDCKEKDHIINPLMHKEYERLKAIVFVHYRLWVKCTLTGRNYQ